MTARLLATYLTITAFVLVVLVVPLGAQFADTQRDELVSDLTRDAVVLASLAEEALEQRAPLDLGDTLAGYGGGEARVVIVDRQGISLVDTGNPTAPRRDFSSRPEVAAALDGTINDGARRSETLGSSFVYVAVPSTSNGIVYGAVRISYPTTAVDARVRTTWLRLGALSAVVLASAGGLGWLLARSVTRPVRRLEDASRRLAEGDLTVRVPTDDGPPELRSLAATFNETGDRLERLVDSQRRFVADASHQLRTPLTALRLRLENLAATSGADRDALDAAAAETVRLGRLVDGLLVLARSDADTPELDVVDARAVAAGRIEAWQLNAAEAGKSVRLSRPEDVSAVPVRVVAGGLEQIVDNLVENALRHSPDGGEVEVSLALDGDFARLSVLDEGPGLPPEEWARALERFWRGAGRQPGGSGLGLAIVAELAEAGGGSVTLEAGAGGRGLTVVVALRRAPRRPDPAAGTSTAAKGAPAVASSARSARHETS